MGKVDVVFSFFFFFFFLFWLYSPWWILASSKIFLHNSRSCYLRLQFLTPMFFRSSSIDSRHFNFWFPQTSRAFWFKKSKHSVRVQVLHSTEISHTPQSSYFEHFGYICFLIERIRLIIVCFGACSTHKKWEKSTQFESRDLQVG
jgi:hypothetical protein